VRPTLPKNPKPAPPTEKPPQPNPPPVQPTPTPPERIPLTPARQKTKASQVTSGAWRLWWEYNRQHIVNLRALLRRPGVITGTAPRQRPDPLGDMREEVLASLRKVARKEHDRTLRASALLALGRMGTPEDALYFVELLQDGSQPRDVHEGAAVALGILPPLPEGAAHKAVETFLERNIRERRALPTRARGLALLSAGLRARTQTGLMMALLLRTTAGPRSLDEAANLAFACGLTESPMVVPELLRAVAEGELGGKKLDDLARAHAAQALARTADPNAARLLCGLLRSRKAGLNSRRSAALALGRLLREAALSDEDVRRADQALSRVFEKERDLILRGFAALALGGGRRPLEMGTLMRAIDHGGNAAIKPYCALALGLGARNMERGRNRKVRVFLREELNKTRDVELASSLSIALGLAGATEASEDLLERVQLRRLSIPVRGAAAEGIGLMETKSPEVADALERMALKEAHTDLLPDIVLALGLMGRRGIAPELVSMLSKSRSKSLQARIILALGHLDHEAAVKPLLDILKHPRERTLVREFAAVALGMMGDRREVDLLFGIDAYFNFYATTGATHELIRLY
jgi:HEAT repeat protein